jgi:hypothetical protein
LRTKGEQRVTAYYRARKGTLMFFRFEFEEYILNITCYIPRCAGETEQR